MDRWDFDCQGRGENIGDAYYVDPVWYQCAQDRGEGEALRSAFLEHVQGSCSAITFNNEGEMTGGTPPTDERLLAELKESIANGLEKGFRSAEVHGQTFILIDYERGTAWWSPKDESEFSEENYQRAGLVRHIVGGRGRGRLGYCFCARCVEELNFHKCSLCGSDLVKVTADQHPGGHWGIRGVREPAPMR